MVSFFWSFFLASTEDSNGKNGRAHIGYDGPKKIKMLGSGSGGFDEFRSQLRDDSCSWGYLRFCEHQFALSNSSNRLLSGDQESKRVKFVFVVWAGQSVGAMAKSRFVAHKPAVTPVVGVCWTCSLR